MSETILDLRGIRCPQVVLAAKRALRDVPVGGILVLECTDALSAVDVPLFVMQTGQRLVKEEKRDALLIFHIERRS